MAVTARGPMRWFAGLIIVAAIAATGTWQMGGRAPVAAMQKLAVPGPLSTAHAFLGSTCTACHTPLAGVERRSCVTCHAVNASIIEREPTAFHATITNCATCHVEHRGALQRPTTMQHAALAKNSGQLDCATCHASKDPHREKLGRECASCHGLDQWSIPAFLHPSPRSTACGTCHLEPPSHRMGHFGMVSQRVARQPDATVEQCYRCHQTTAWNDIIGVGWYKHH